MIEVIKNTISSSLTLFQEKRGDYFNFSFLFLLLFSLATAVLSIFYLYILDYFYDLHLDNDTSPLKLLFFSNYSLTLTQFSQGLFLISLGLYVIFLDKMKDKTKAVPTINLFFAFLRTNDYVRYVVIIMIYTFISLLSYGGILGTSNIKEGSEGILGVVENFAELSNHSFRLYQWIDSIFALMIQFFPYFSALYLALCSFEEFSIKQYFKRNGKNILAVIIVCFFLESIIYSFILDIDIYIIPIKEIMFTESISSIVWGLIIHVCLHSYFLLFISGVLLYLAQFSWDFAKPEEKTIFEEEK